MISLVWKFEKKKITGHEVLTAITMISTMMMVAVLLKYRCIYARRPDVTLHSTVSFFEESFFVLGDIGKRCWFSQRVSRGIALPFRDLGA